MQLKQCFRCRREYRFDLLQTCPACKLKTKFQSYEYELLLAQETKAELESVTTNSDPRKNENLGNLKTNFNDLESSNYLRGNIFRDINALEKSFPDVFTDKSIVSSNAFIFAFKNQDEEGILLADLVHLVIRNREILLLGFPNVVLRISVDQLEKFEFAAVDHFPPLFFPPGIPPQRLGLFELLWRNSRGKSLTLHLLFPDIALYPFELEFPSENVHRALGELNTQKKFFSDPYYNSANLKSFAASIFNQLGGVPDEVSKFPCYFQNNLDL